MVGGLDAGNIRFLQLVLDIDDRGVTRKLSRAASAMNLVEVASSQAAAQVRVLRNALGVLGVAAGAAGAASAAAFARFERTSKLAAFSAAESVEEAEQSLGQLQERTLELASEFGEAPNEVAKLERSLAQMGVTAEGARKALERSSIVGAKVAEEVEAEDLSRTIFRLAFAVKQSNQEAQQFIERTGPGLASALINVARNTPGGVSATEKFLEKLQSANSVMQLSASELISLSASFNTMFSQGRRASTAASSFLRLFTRTAAENINTVRKTVDEFGSALSENTRANITQSEEAFDRFLAEERFDAIRSMSSAIRNMALATEAGAMSQQEFTKQMQELGLESVRTTTVLSTLGITAKQLPKFVEEASDEMQNGVEGQTRLMAEWRSLQEDLLTQWGIMVSRVKILAVQIGGNLDGSIVDALGSMNQFLKTMIESEDAAKRLADALKAITAVGIGGFLGLLSLKLPFTGGALAGLGKFARGKLGVGGGRSAASGGQAVRESMRSAGSTALDYSLEAITRVVETIGSVFNKLKPANVAKVFGNVGDKLAGVFNRAVAGMEVRTMGKVVGRGLMNGLVSGGAAAARVAMNPLAAAMALLEPVFQKIAEWFDELANRGGILGAILQGMAITFELLEVVGNAIGLVFDAIMLVLEPLIPVFKALWQLLKDGTNWIGKKMMPYLQDAFDALSRVNDAIDFVREGMGGLADFLRDKVRTAANWIPGVDVSDPSEEGNEPDEGGGPGDGGTGGVSPAVQTLQKADTTTKPDTTPQDMPNTQVGTQNIDNSTNTEVNVDNKVSVDASEKQKQFMEEVARASIVEASRIKLSFEGG
jgi:hypothetical protein